MPESTRWVPVVCNACSADKMLYESIVEDGLRLTHWSCPGCGLVFECRLEERREWSALVNHGDGCEEVGGFHWISIGEDPVDPRSMVQLVDAAV